MNSPLALYLGGFDFLFVLLVWRWLRLSPRSPRSLRVIVGASTIALLVNGSALFCRERIVTTLCVFGGIGIVAVLFSMFSRPAAAPTEPSTERQRTLIFLRALVPGLLLFGPLFVLGLSLLESSGHPAEHGSPTPVWTKIAEAVGFGFLYAFSVYERTART